MERRCYVSARLQILTVGMLMIEVLYETLRRFNLEKITDVSEDRNAGMLYPYDEGTTVFRKVVNSLPVDTV